MTHTKNFCGKKHSSLSLQCFIVFISNLYNIEQVALFTNYINVLYFRKKIPSCLIGFGWIMACNFSLISMYSIAIFFNPDHQPNDLENAIYSALHRIGWSVSIGWIIMVCITDNAGKISMNFLRNQYLISFIFSDNQ